MASYVLAMVGEMTRSVLTDALTDLARIKETAYLKMFADRELAHYADPYREQPSDAPETTSMLRTWFVLKGSATLRGVKRASVDARCD